MNKKKFLVFLVVLTPLFCFSQEIVLPSIKTPGGNSVGIISGAVLGENLFGPQKIVFFSEQGDLQNRQVEKTSSKFGAETSQSGKIPTLYSGRIFSPGINEPFVFKDKTQEELAVLEVRVFPIRLEQPYTLYMDLTVQASSMSVKSNKSTDAGRYTANLVINLIKL